MAMRSGFFNSVNDDRLYSANEFAEYFATFIGNGVFPSPTTSLQVQPDTGLTIRIKAGKAWINGYYFIADADETLAIQPDPILPRIDRLVLRLHLSNREITLVHKQGTAASTPSTPVVTRDAQMIEFSLAILSIPAGASSITAAMITDTRSNITECGFVTSTITNIPIMTANRTLISSGTGELSVSSVTSQELGNLSGNTSNIQTQLNGKQATITGAASTITSNNLTASRALQSDASGKVSISAITSTELGQLSGVTSAIQSQLNSKQATITGAASSIVTSNLTDNRVLVSDANGKISASLLTTTELGHVSGVNASIQTQLNGKLATTAQAVDSLKINGKKIHVGTSPPASPAIGDLWVDTN